MKRLRKCLLLLIVAELMIGAAICVQRAGRPEPPLPNLGKLDAETSAALQSLRDKARDGNSRDWRELAEGYLGNGFYLAAEGCFQRAMELDPGDQQAAYGRGFCLERTGRTSEAIPILTAVAKVADAELAWTCWYQVGRCCLREDNINPAETAFRQIPDFAPAVYQLCKLLIRTNRTEDAVPLIDHQLEQYPNDVKFLQLRGKAAEALGDQATVAEIRDREDRAAYLVEMEYGLRFLGMLSAKLGLGSRLSRALDLKESGTAEQQSAVLHGALTIIRKNSFWNYRSVFVAMAEVELALGHFPKVRELLDEVRKNSQDGPDLLDLEGKLLLAEDRPDEAANTWQRALSMRPSIELYEQLEKVSGDASVKAHCRAQVIFLTGLAEFQKNHVEEALPYFERAAELEPENTTHLYYLGDAHRLLGNTDAASAAFAKCVEINPDHGRTRQHQTWMLRKSKK